MRLIISNNQAATSLRDSFHAGSSRYLTGAPIERRFASYCRCSFHNGSRRPMTAVLLSSWPGKCALDHPRALSQRCCVHYSLVAMDADQQSLHVVYEFLELCECMRFNHSSDRSAIHTLMSRLGIPRVTCSTYNGAVVVECYGMPVGQPF